MLEIAQLHSREKSRTKEHGMSITKNICFAYTNIPKSSVLGRDFPSTDSNDDFLMKHYFFLLFFN